MNKTFEFRRIWTIVFAMSISASLSAIVYFSLYHKNRIVTTQGSFRQLNRDLFIQHKSSPKYVELKSSTNDITYFHEKNGAFEKVDLSFPEGDYAVETDSRRYLTVSHKSKQKLFDLQNRRFIDSSHSPSSSDTRESKRFSPDDALLFYVGNGKPIVCNLSTGREYKVGGSTSKLINLQQCGDIQGCFSPDSRFAYILNHRLNTLSVWSRERFKVVKEIKLPYNSKGNCSMRTSSQFAIECWGKDGVVALCNGDSNLELWDPKSGINLKEYVGLAGWCLLAKASPDCSKFAIAVSEDETLLFDTQTLEKSSLITKNRFSIYDWIEETDYPYHMEFSDDSRLLLTAAVRAGGLQVWDANTGKRKYSCDTPGYPTPVSFDDAGAKLIYLDNDDTKIVDL